MESRYYNKTITISSGAPGLVNRVFAVHAGTRGFECHRRWRPPYQTSKTVHVQQTNYKDDADGRTAPGVRGHGSVPLSHSANVVTRIGLHTEIEILAVHSIY